MEPGKRESRAGSRRPATARPSPRTATIAAGKRTAAAVAPTRKRLSGVERRVRITEAAREVFLADGYAGARTRAIAVGAGITEAVLYQHFASKEELFEAAILVPLQDEVDQMHLRLRAVVDDGLAAARADVLELLEVELIKSMQRVIPLLGVALFSGRELGEKAYGERAYRNFNRSPVGEIPALLGWRATKLGSSTQLELWMSMVCGLVLESIFDKKSINRSKTSRQLAALLLHGLSSPPKV